MRREAEKTIFPILPSVPGYALWLNGVMRIVMDRSGDPIGYMKWWNEVITKTLNELADSGALCRWDLKIGTSVLKECSGHIRLFL